VEDSYPVTVDIASSSVPMATAFDGNVNGTDAPPSAELAIPMAPRSSFSVAERLIDRPARP
jgi:hypothetical protein